MLAGLGGITVVAWVYMVVAARRMSMRNAMIGVRPWTSTEFGLTLATWAVMMVAMMVPTAAPMTLLCAARTADARQLEPRAAALPLPLLFNNLTMNK